MNSFFNMTFADTMRKYLNKAINDAIEEYREQDYPDFTRNRKLDMNTMIRFMLTMNGEALTKNYMKLELRQVRPHSCNSAKNWKYPCFRAYWNIITCYAMIMCNFANRIIQNIVIENAQNNVHEYAVNRKMATYLCKEFFRAPWASGKELMERIAKYTEPVRPDRQDERKIKPQSFKGFVYRVSA